MRILITGGAGYLGTGVVAQLSQMEGVEEIILYDNLSRGSYNLFLGGQLNPKIKIKLIQGDILDSRKLKKALEGIDVVFHLAAKVNMPYVNSDGHSFEQINHWGTAELVYAIEESNVKKFVYTSSASVYGSSSKNRGEDSQPNPRTVYAISKLRGEEQVARLMDKCETYILRCGNIYGYNKSIRFDMVINQFMFNAHYNRRISIHGTGKQQRAFVNINTISHVLSHLIFSQAPSGIYNLFDKNHHVLDIVDILKEMYPDLEFIFINQHLNLREICLEETMRLKQYMDWPRQRDLREDLLEFKQQFSF